MDPGTIQLLILLAAAVALVEFFHVGYLVAKIHNEAVKQTKLLLASNGALIGKKASFTGIYPEPSKDGYVKMMGEEWECLSEKAIPSGAVVRVSEVDGILLHVIADGV